MALLIKELHVILNANERQNTPRNPGDSSGRRQEKEASEEAIIAECVAQTLQILHNKKER